VAAPRKTRQPRRGAGRPRHADGQPGRERIAEAALSVFAERGYDGSAVADLATAAGVAASVIYHHFDSKAGLWTAILERENQRLIEHVAAAVPPRGGKARRLPAGVEAYFSFVEQNRAAWRLLVREPSVDPELRALHERLQAERARSIAALYDGPRAGAGARRDKARFTGLLATAIRAFAGWWDENPDVPRAAVVDAVVAFSDSAAKSLLREQ
jgi:AcrR family transcriptional regulator